MRTFDLSPLYRSAIGFDRLAALMDEALRPESHPSYPPYNIERTEEDKYRITMAVAGFAESELDVVVERDTLTVKGSKAKEDGEKTYLYRGIAGRGFERRFQLADHMKVTGARLENGLLHIDVVREIPEAMKPRKIEVATGDSPHVISSEAA